ncbi:Bug family tripartite tricarboxylate transporter substrate binding protein [Ramlibacter albus]|uniref:Tripartite tricarboxylate transporter substrate binding protein n=1 Tax=Ramlibacter albus TaxID=2079448 RepID=A0A923MAX2_9BURK|nr:tripartite tricarboxylate transporter substrate binding protein [Ramlibacter albus]MBC5765988.1 tripartite tricarboxylate transporter substrate binding protein [Ramlibacter albus]
MTASRRALLAFALACASAQVPAQTYPSQPVKIVVPFPAGGTADVLARLLADRLTKRWGQPVTVDNKPGGGTVIGTAFVAKAPPDGHTMLIMAGSFVINAKLRTDLPYPGLKAFEPVAGMAYSPQVIAVPPNSPYRTFADWVADAKARPGTVSIGSVGPATTQHIASEMLQRGLGIKLIYTPFQGGAPAVTAAMGGHVHSVMANLSEMTGQLEGGRLRALAVTSRERVDSLKQVPTVAESGVAGYEANAWFGYVVPAGTPPDVIAKIAEGVRAALAEPDVHQRIAGLGMHTMYMDPKAFAAHIAEEYAKYSRTIDEARIKPE